MADDQELERRAVEELLSEATRARIRAETMGPAGWVKSPLRSTNKRFLLNTLRTTALQRRPGGRTGHSHSEAHEDGRQGMNPWPSDRTSSSDYRRVRSRSPVRALPPDQNSTCDRHAHRQSNHSNGHRHTQSYHRNGHRHTESNYSNRHRHTQSDHTDKHTHRTAESPASLKTHK